MDPSNGILQKLLDIQRELKVEKGTYNEFGGFYYRSKEDILEAVKPLCHERGLTLICDDEIVCIDSGWSYVITTATLTDALTGEAVSAKSAAREPKSKPKMDISQVTGSAASYAGKRALGNLFALDDTKDADAYGQGDEVIGACTACGMRYIFQSADQLNSGMCQCGSTSFQAV